MSVVGSYQDLGVDLLDRHVALVEIRRPPDNFFDDRLIGALADAFEALDELPDCRVLVLAAQGRNFCAGANLGGGNPMDLAALYRHASRLFRTRKPVVGAIQGAAVGGGLGLALVPDFRVTCREARFSANFARLGTHPGFGLSVTLPRLVGDSAARIMFYTGRRIPGAEAVDIGLADRLVARDDVRVAAIDMAREVAGSAPLAVQSIRATLREGLADLVSRATEHELREQTRLGRTADFAEGVSAMAERRPPEFRGS